MKTREQSLLTAEVLEEIADVWVNCYPDSVFPDQFLKRAEQLRYPLIPAEIKLDPMEPPTEQDFYARQEELING